MVLAVSTLEQPMLSDMIFKSIFDFWIFIPTQDISRVFFVKFNSFKNYIGVNLDTYIVVMFLDIEFESTFNIIAKTY